jgi:hypothetical protein
MVTHGVVVRHGFGARIRIRVSDAGPFGCLAICEGDNRNVNPQPREHMCATICYLKETLHAAA